MKIKELFDLNYWKEKDVMDIIFMTVFGTVVIKFAYFVYSAIFG